MPFFLDEVVPWGRSFDEYCRMFALTDSDLERPILGCADGPAAFNAELTRRGGNVVSCDPLYMCLPEEIEARIHDCFDAVLEQARLHANDFVWSNEIPDVATLGKTRMDSMRQFLDDFPTGQRERRYVTAELPSLPFSDGEFDLALCSHYLFLYGTLGLSFHVESIIELARVAAEVRIFPLVQLNGQKSPFLPEVCEALKASGFLGEIVPAAYEFQRGACETLRVTHEAD